MPIDPQAILAINGREEPFGHYLYEVVMESPAEVFGFQATVGGTPHITLRSFVRLAAGGDLDLVPYLFAPQQDLVQDSLAYDLGRELRSLSDAFVGRHLIDKYRYQVKAYSLQVLHGKWADPDDIEKYGWDVTAAKDAAWFGFRGAELLSNRRLQIPMEGDRAVWLDDLLHGEIPFDDWWTDVQVLDTQLESFRDNERIPEGPDVRALEEWVVSAYQRWWGLTPVA